MIDIRAILQCIPHRYPFLLIDRIDSMEPGRRIVALKNVSFNEPYFPGHFPLAPVMPGVLIVESLAQLSGLVGLSRCAAGPGRHGGRLAHVDIRFDRPVVPPAEIVLHSRHTRTLEALHQFEVEARVADHAVARGQITLAEVIEP